MLTESKVGDKMSCMSRLISEVTRLNLGGRLRFGRLLCLLLLLMGETTTPPATLKVGDVGGESSSIDDPNDGSGTPAASSFQEAMVKQVLALLVVSHNQQRQVTMHCMYVACLYRRKMWFACDYPVLSFILDRLFLFLLPKKKMWPAKTFGLKYRLPNAFHSQEDVDINTSNLWAQ